MPDIPDEAVEAALEAVRQATWNGETYVALLYRTMEAALTAAYPHLLAENARLRAQVEAVRKLHQCRTRSNLLASTRVTYDECRECYAPWPCPTIGALSDEGKP